MKEKFALMETQTGEASAVTLLQSIWQEAEEIAATEAAAAAKRRAATLPPPPIQEGRAAVVASRVRFAHD